MVFREKYYITLVTMSGGRRRRGTRRSNKGAFVTKKQMKRENHLIENGQRFNPSIHPPDFCAIPWFNLIVRVESFTTLSIGVDGGGAISVISSLKTQLNLPTATVIEFRLQNIRIWGPIVPMNSSSSLSNLRVQFWSLIEQAGTSTGTSFSILEDISAYPDQVSRASVGFTWPKAQQAVALQQQINGIICNLTSGGGAQNVAYVKVVWRPRPSFTAELLPPLSTFAIS